MLGFAALLGIQASVYAGNGFDPSLTAEHPKLRGLIAIQNRATPEMMKVPGVLGTAIGLNDDGDAALVIYVDCNAPSAGHLPPVIEGVPVKEEQTEKFVAFVSHTASQ